MPYGFRDFVTTGTFHVKLLKGTSVLSQKPKACSVPDLMFLLARLCGDSLRTVSATLVGNSKVRYQDVLLDAPASWAHFGFLCLKLLIPNHQKKTIFLHKKMSYSYFCTNWSCQQSETIPGDLFLPQHAKEPKIAFRSNSEIMPIPQDCRLVLEGWHL